MVSEISRNDLAVIQGSMISLPIPALSVTDVLDTVRRVDAILAHHEMNWSAHINVGVSVGVIMWMESVDRVESSYEISRSLAKSRGN